MLLKQQKKQVMNLCSHGYSTFCLRSRSTEPGGTSSIRAKSVCFSSRLRFDLILTFSDLKFGNILAPGLKFWNCFTERNPPKVMRSSPVNPPPPPPWNIHIHPLMLFTVYTSGRWQHQVPEKVFICFAKLIGVSDFVWFFRWICSYVYHTTQKILSLYNLALTDKIDEFVTSVAN